MEKLIKGFPLVVICLLITLTCDKDFSSINSIEITNKISGDISQLEPTGSFKSESCIVELHISQLSLIENTDENGNFTFDLNFEMLEDNFRIKITKPGFTEVDTIIHASDVLDTIRHEITGLHFLIRKYVNYFPIKVGNYWLYDAEWGASGMSSGHAEGTERWEIIEVIPDSNLFKIRSTVSSVGVNTEMGVPIGTFPIENTMVANIKFEDRRIMGYGFGSVPAARNNLIEFLKQYFYEGASDSLYVVFPFNQDSVYYYYNQAQSPRLPLFYSKLKLDVGFLEIRLNGRHVYSGGTNTWHYLTLIDYQIQP